MQLESKHQEIMRKNSMFSDLPESDFLRVFEHTTLCKLATGEILFRQQQAATYFYLLLSGKIKLSLLSIDGCEKVVDIISPGNTFAEAVIFRGLPGYPVNSEAISDSHVLKINALTYKDILRNSPEACFKVMSCLSIRIHWLMNEINRLCLHNATYRLIRYLLENIPEETTTPTEVHLSIPKHVIASRISVTPETFSRTIKRLSDQDLLKVHDTHIVLINPVELRNMISI